MVPMYEAKCDNCEGRGQHEGGKLCNPCGGTGRVMEEFTVEERLERIEETLGLDVFIYPPISNL